MASKSPSLETFSTFTPISSQELSDSLELSDESTTSELSESATDGVSRYFASWFSWSPLYRDDSLLEDIRDTFREIGCYFEIRSLSISYDSQSAVFDLAISHEHESDPIAIAFAYANHGPSVLYHDSSPASLPITVSPETAKSCAPVVENWLTVQPPATDVESCSASSNLRQAPSLSLNINPANDSILSSAPSTLQSRASVDVSQEQETTSNLSSENDKRIDLSSVPTQDLEQYLPSIPSLDSWRALKVAHDEKFTKLESSAYKPSSSAFGNSKREGLKRTPAIRRPNCFTENFTTMTKRTSIARERHGRHSLPAVGSPQNQHESRPVASSSAPNQYVSASKTPNATLKENLTPRHHDVALVNAAKGTKLEPQLPDVSVKNNRVSLPLPPVKPLTIRKRCSQT
jgi:hypothetical protein